MRDVSHANKLPFFLAILFQTKNEGKTRILLFELYFPGECSIFMKSLLLLLFFIDKYDTK